MARDLLNSELQQFEAQELANSAWGLATMLLTMPGLEQAVWRHELRGQELSNTMRAFATLQLGSYRFWSFIASEAVANRAELNPQGQAVLRLLTPFSNPFQRHSKAFSKPVHCVKYVKWVLKST